MSPSSLAGIDVDAVIDAALDATRQLDHCDVRIVATRTAYLTQRDHDPMANVDQLALGVGVRVLDQGCWGFAGTADVSPEGAAKAATHASAMLRASRAAATSRVELAPEPVHIGEWTSQFAVDPFDIPAADRMSWLSAHCDNLLAAGPVHHASGSVMAVREQTAFGSSAGSRLKQTRVRLHAEITGIRVSDDGGFESLRTTAPPTGRGWEYLTGGCEPVGPARPWDWDAELAELPGRLEQKAAAPSIEPGRYTLVVHPTNLWLTIHESVGHATELDRVLGYEANYAGTSFVTTDGVGRLKYGSPHMNVTADRVTPHGLATVGWDDEGVAAQRWPLVSRGVLVGLQLDRAMAAASGQSRSNGCAYADSAIHTPIQRMPNVGLEPDPDGGLLEDLVGGVEDGILIVGDGSWSIDMQRYNFQFTGQRFERIKAGRLVGQVKDVAYQGSTPGFWGSLVALGGPDSVLLGGAFNCGKGQPGQVAPVSHACPPAVFENVNVLNSAAEGVS
ncbi:MAG: TldD/PmbA family protein [Candidatus Nanopelagicales bacterium]|nr:TldD/PmbA family protein [Candidatus Nanopelagicales bacterium]